MKNNTIENLKMKNIYCFKISSYKDKYIFKPNGSQDTFQKIDFLKDLKYL